MIAVLHALQLLDSADDPDGELQREARWCLSERRRPLPIAGLPEALGRALASARAQAAARALEAADEALWAAADRCQRGWPEHVGWQRLEAELRPEERAAACVSGRKGRRLATAWGDAKRRRARA